VRGYADAVFGLTERYLFALAVVLYGVSTLYSVFLWRRGFRKDNRILYLLLLAAMALHTIAMAKRGFSLSRCPVSNLFEATIFSTWAIVTSYLVIGLVRRLRFLGAFAAPVLFCVGVFALMPGLDTHGPQPTFAPPLSSLHASLTMLAYGAFGLGAIAAAMYLNQERDLKQHKLRAVLALLPPIQRLEVVTSRSVTVGLALLSAGMVLGILWLKHEKGVYFLMDAKVLWTIFVWLVYGVLLVRRWPFDQGGRRFAWGVIGSFGFILLTFAGFNLLSPIHHP
jgi:HemX protein